MKSLWLYFKNLYRRIFGLELSRPSKKLVIVLSGGAMNCVYGAGFLKALLELKLPKKYIIIAASGSAGNASYFLSGQIEESKSFWTEYVSENKLINFKSKKILDIDYLIDDLFKKVFPLDLQALKKSNIDLYVPAICYETGKVRYFESRDENLDWHEVLRAAKALPVIYGKKVEIEGLHYFDTPYSSSWKVHMEKALELGATHTVIIDLSRLYNSNITKSLTEFVIKNFMFSDTANYDTESYFDTSNFEVNTVNNVFIKPKNLLSNLETDKVKLERLWQDGYDEVFQNQDLKNLLLDLQR